MSFRCYLIPADIQGNYRGPKYLKWRMNPSGIDTHWGAMDYGFAPYFLVVCPNITVANHNLLSGNLDVLTFPENLDQSINDNNFKSGLESSNIPTDWTTASTTYREMLRMLAGLFQFAQRYNGISGEALFNGTVTLETNFKSMTTQQQNWFNQTAQEFGATGNVLGNPKLRSLAKQAGDLWGTKPFLVAGIEF